MPTTWTCECFGRLRREELIPVVRSTKEGRLEGSICPQYRITACGRRLPFKAGGEVFGLGWWCGGVAGVVTEVLTASAKLLREEDISFLRSSTFPSSAAIEAVSTGRGRGMGPRWTILLGRSARSAQMERTSLAMVFSRSEEGYRICQIGLCSSRWSVLEIRRWR